MSSCTHRNSCAMKEVTCSSCNSFNVNPAPHVAVRANQKASIDVTLSQIKHTLFIMSGKGGVGKSMVTVNLAVALAARGCKVGVLDVDLHGPSVPVLLGLKEKLTVADDGTALFPLQRGDNMRVLSVSLLLTESDVAVIWRGPQKNAAIRQFLSGVIWGDLDYLLIDSPPGTGDEHLAILQAIPTAQCLMVTTPQELSLSDVRKALNFLEKIKANLFGVIENMSAFTCPHCGGNISLFAKDGGRALAQKRNIPFLGTIPFDPLVSVAAELGKPVVEFAESSVAKCAFFTLADHVTTRLI